MFFFADYLMVGALIVKNYEINLLKNRLDMFFHIWVLDTFYILFSLRHAKTIENFNV